MVEIKQLRSILILDVIKGYIFSATHLPTCNPEISGRKLTWVHSFVSYATMRHLLQTVAIRHISRCVKYENIFNNTLSGNFSMV